MKVCKKLKAFFKASKYCEFPLEGIFAEKQIKHSIVIALATLPIGIRHCDLIEICKHKHH